MGPFTQKGPRLHCLLGIETSGDLCSVAVSKSAAILSKKSLQMPYGQAGYLMGLIQEVLIESDIDWKQLTGVVVNRGPGSFTGLRVGLATAQGISLAGNLPIFGLTGFETYRSLETTEKNLLILIDTRREDCFVSFFKKNSSEPTFSQVMSYEDIHLFCQSEDDVRLIGNVDASLVPNAHFSLLEADDILRSFAFYRDTHRTIFSSEPYYLREPEIHGKQGSL